MHFRNVCVHLVIFINTRKFAKTLIFTGSVLFLSFKGWQLFNSHCKIKVIMLTGGSGMVQWQIKIIFQSNDINQYKYCDNYNYSNRNCNRGNIYG